VSTNAHDAVAKNSTGPEKALWLAGWAQVIPALLVGLALRIFLVLRFPSFADDSRIYEDLAGNWLRAHVYGLAGPGGAIVATDIRAPGYPTFLTLVYLIIGRGQWAISLAQTFLDLGTCFLVAWLAARLAVGAAGGTPSGRQSTVGMAALWLAVTCPLVANYAAIPLTEVLATFLTAAALLAFVSGFLATDCPEIITGPSPGAWMFFAGGLLAGLGTLARPETPLLLLALALVLALRWRRPANWSKLVRAGLLTAMGVLLPLAPWAARNWIRFHEVQFLAPRYAASAGEYVPRGLYAWTATWLVRYRDVYQVPWKISTDPIALDDLPPSAFDSPAERARVAALLAQYNENECLTPELDRGFAQLARERTARHPLRTHLWVPLERAATLWLTPRTELLPVSGHLTPLREQWRDDPVDVTVTLLLGALNFLYLGLAIAGALRIAHTRSRHATTAAALLVTFILVRTAFLTQVETPEPRYVLECFPALLALGAMCWLGKPSSTVLDGS